MLNMSELARGGTKCHGKAGLAEGAGAHTLLILAADGTAFLNYSINGIAYVKADTDNIAMTALVVQPDLYSCLYLVTLNAGGDLAIVKGVQRLTADVTSGKNPLQWPVPAEDTCPIGGFRIDTDGITFTSGTTDLAAVAAAGTVTYYDFARVPDTPIVS